MRRSELVKGTQHDHCGSCCGFARLGYYHPKRDWGVTVEVNFPHEIVFGTKKAVSVSDVAASLIANDQILFDVARILEKCFAGLVIEKISVEFRTATTSSP